MTKKLFLICTTILATSYPLAAAELTLLAGAQFNSDFEIAENAGIQPASSQAGSTVDVSTDAIAGIAVDFVLDNNPKQRFGFFVSRQQAEFEQNFGLSNNELDITHLHLTFMNYYPDGKWQHFVLGGIGASWYDVGDDLLSSETRPSGQLAFGTSYPIIDNLYVRAEARWIASFFDSTSSVFCSDSCVITVKSEVYSQFQANAGITFKF